MKPQTRFALFASLAFFVALSAWSFGAPIGEGADGDHHLSSIWCGWGESEGMCEDRGDFGNGYVATVPYMFQMCNGRPSEDVTTCQFVTTELKPDNMQTLRTSTPQTRSLYYSLMRTFASENPTRSVLEMRFFNSFLASVILFFLLTLTRGRARFAVLCAWTLTLVPNGVATLSSYNPRSWAFLGVMSSWAFLYSALTCTSSQRRRRIGSYILFGVSISLAAATRWDATIFSVFSSTIVLLAYLTQNKMLSLRRTLQITGPICLLALIAVLTVPYLKGLANLSGLRSYPQDGRLLFNLIHIPETLPEIFGYSVGYSRGGPGIIGIIGLALFAFCIGNALRGMNRSRIALVGLTTLFIFISSLRMSIAANLLFPFSGVYLLGLLTFLIGLTVLLSETRSGFMMSRTSRISVITLTALCQMLALYNYMEAYTRLGIGVGTYAKISLNGAWWWGFGPGPNYVFVIGSISYAVFLAFAWMTAPLITADTTTETSILKANPNL